MKLLRTLTATALVAAVVATSVSVAGARPTKYRMLDAPGRRLLAARSQASTATLGSFATTGTPIPTGRVLVRMKDSATPQALSALGHEVGASTGNIGDVKHDRLVWRTPRGRSALEFAKQLQDSGEVVYAVPDYERKLTYTPPAYVAPDDPAILSTRGWQTVTAPIATYDPGLSWWLRDIRAMDAWAEGYTGSSIVGKYPLRASGSAMTVAVIDSGLYGGAIATHPDEGVNIVGGKDYFDHEDGNVPPMLVEDNDVSPVPWTDIPTTYTDPFLRELVQRTEASHGTCVAGEIGMTVHNGIGSAGVGYDTRVVVHKVMGIRHNGDVTIDDLAVCNAIRDSVDVTQAKVISMSFGGYDYSQAIADWVGYAHAHNVVVVAAKGNDNSGSAFYPADNNHVVSVGALDKNVNGTTVAADFTNYRATSRDIMAPGAFVFAPTDPGYDPLASSVIGSNPGYFVWDGTSMATPIVAGAIAWLWRAAPALSADEIENEVFASAKTHGAVTHFPKGYRELDMYAAYKRLEADYPLLTKPALVDQTVAALGPVPVSWGVSMAKQRGVTYNASIDGAGVATASPATGGSFALATGDHTVSAQAHSVYNWDDGTAANTATLHVLMPVAGPSSWAAAHFAGGAATVAFPGYHQAIAIDAPLTDASSTPLAGAPVRLQSSSDGANFADVASAPISKLSSGTYRAAVAPEAKTYYRFVSATDGDVLGSTSSAVVVIPHVSITTPSAKSTISHKTKLALSGTLKPAHSSGSRVVKLTFQRWNGHVWKTWGSAWTAVKYRNSSYSTYSASVRLPKGSFRVSATALADSRHAATSSGYKSVRVK